MIQTFDLKIQLMGFNSDLYSNHTEATMSTHGLAVISVLGAVRRHLYHRDHCHPHLHHRHHYHRHFRHHQYHHLFIHVVVIIIINYKNLTTKSTTISDNNKQQEQLNINCMCCIKKLKGFLPDTISEFKTPCFNYWKLT